MNKILLTVILLVASFCGASELKASIAPNSRKVFYVGEQAYVAVEIEDYADDAKRGNSYYFLRHESGNAPWLFYDYRPDYNDQLDNAPSHWQNNQSFWIELIGKATQPGFYKGVVYAYHTDFSGVVVEEKYLDYSFEVRDYEHDLVVKSRDYAASYDRQIDFYSYIDNLSNTPITLNNPYMDYYMTKGSGKQLILNVWGKPRNSCVQVLDCGDNHFVVRQRMTGAVELSSETINSKDAFQLAINERPPLYSVYRYTPLSEKDENAYDESSVDYSYNGYSIDYSTRAMHRNWFYNDHMVLVANGGVRYYGNPPDWYSEESCHAATLTTSTEYLESEVRTESESKFCQDAPSPLSSSSSVRSSSSDWSSSSSVQSSSSIRSSSSSTNLVVRFADVPGGNGVQMHIDVKNKSNQSVDLDGYEIWFYFNDESADMLAQSTFSLYHPTDGPVSQEIKKCSETEYVLKLHLGSGASVEANKTFPNGAIQGNLHEESWQYNYNKSNFASWKNYSTLTENPQMALFDKQGGLVYGEIQWPCDGDSEKSLILTVEGKSSDKDVKVDGISDKIKNAAASVSLKINNYGDSVVSGPVYVDFQVTQAAGSVPILVMGSKKLSVAGRSLVVNDQGGPISIARISAGDKHTFRFTLLNGIGAARASKPYSREISFELMNQCLSGCRDKEEAALLKWNRADDWSAGGLGSSYVVTDRVPIYNSRNVLLYGVPDPSAPMYAVSNSADLVQPRAEIDPQVPNRTDAVLYSAGQLLSGGDFETPWVQGWNISCASESCATPLVKSVRTQSPQGSRHLFVNAWTIVRQGLPQTANKILADSGAVLNIWHKGGKALVKVNGLQVATLESSPDMWIHRLISIKPSDFEEKKSNNLSIETEADTILVDNAALVPSNIIQPFNYAIRFTNTYGEELETRTYDGDNEQLITTSERDHLGRLWKKYLPFAKPCDETVGCNSDIMTLNNPGMAKSFYTSDQLDYPDAGGVPYAETVWKPDQQATIDAVGAPGAAFGLDSAHLSRFFYSGVNMDGVDLLDSSSLNSAVSACLDMRRYGGSRHAEKDTNYHAAKDSDPTHLWELVIDQDERRAFTVKDGEGRVIVSGSLDKDGNLHSRSVNEFDARGNVVKSHPPMSCEYTNAPANCVDPSTFEYDSQSRLIKRNEPDAGVSLAYYDIAGRLRATQTQRQIDSGWVSVVGYDRLDRVIYTGKWETSLDEAALREYFNNVDNLNSPTVDELTPGTVTRTFYDRTPANDTLGVKLYTLGVGLPPTYTFGRVAAVVSDVRAVFDDDGSAVVATDGSDSVLRVSYAYSYDKYGRVLANYAYDPTMPADSLKMLWTTTKYDLGGKVVSTTKIPYGTTFPSFLFRPVTERYTYDRLGRVEYIYSKNGTQEEVQLAHYKYYPTGSVKSVDLGNSLVVSYTYHISGAVKTAEVKDASGANLYSETLYYEDCGSDDCKPQYNGNISRMVHQLAHGNSEYGERRDVAYTYDMLNRLVGVDDSEQDVFDEIFEYDAQGRIAAQRRAEKKKKGYQIPASGGEYTYENKTNRLKSVAEGVGRTSAAMKRRYVNTALASEWFQYDKEGNLIEDRSKWMSVAYDWRGMPVEFRMVNRGSCAQIPGRGVICDSIKLVLAYDGMGRRISKTRMYRGFMSAGWNTEVRTHYTGIGTEIRENLVNNETKVVMNMPQGLGRYGVEDADRMAEDGSAQTFEWFLKNHLGSTMLVYGTGGTSGGLKAAYDYRSFGEQIELTSPSTGKVTENFTGKERDDETQLDYFGARYLDPMLGMWISVDPARQYQNPYLYAGNNPIMRIDPDGNQDGSSLGWEVFVRDMHINEIRVIEKMPEAMADVGKNAAVATWKTAKYGTALAALIAVDPSMRALLIATSSAMNLAEAAFEKDGVGVAKAGLGTAASILTRNAKIPQAIAINFAVDISGLMVECIEDGIKEKINADPTKLLPTSGSAPADNTNVSIPIREE